MSLHLDISPQAEARFTAAARQNGIDPAAYFEKIVFDYLPPVTSEAKASPVIDEENAAVIALMDEWLAEAPTDPEGIRQAQAEVDELMQNLNKNRMESGESPLFS
jgi:hypothetical protein